MSVNQIAAAYLAQNIETSSLFSLFSEVENAIASQISFTRTQQELCNEASQDAA